MQKKPAENARNNPRSKVTQDDIEQMIHKYGLNAKELSTKLDNSSEADKEELNELIQPFLNLSHADEDDETHLKSLEQSQKEDDDLKEKDKKIPEVQPEFDKNELAQIIVSEGIDMGFVGTEEQQIHKDFKERRDRLKAKIEQLVALITQHKNGAINVEQFWNKVNTILPIKKFPAVVQFVKQNGIDMGGKSTVAKGHKETLENKPLKENQATTSETSIKAKTDLLNEILGPSLESRMQSAHIERSGQQKGLQR